MNWALPVPAPYQDAQNPRYRPPPNRGRRQVGIACQKVSEAEVFAAAGFKDIQIPYNIVWARAKPRRLADAGESKPM